MDRRATPTIALFGTVRHVESFRQPFVVDARGIALHGLAAPCRQKLIPLRTGENTMLEPVVHDFTQSNAVVAPPMPMKLDTQVLHVVNGEHFSGAERVQSHLGRCLPQFGVRADFACLKPGKFAEMIERDEGACGRIERIPMSNRFDFRPTRQLADLVHRHDYRLLHAHTPRAAMVTAITSAMTGVPWVYHVHSPASRDSMRSLINHVNAWIEKQSLRGAAHLITVSESLRLDCIAKGVEDRRVTVVHNGVPAIRPSRQSIPRAGGPWVLGMVALMRPRKGLEIALDATAELANRGHDVVLRCIGPFESESYQSQIEEHIEALNIGHRVERVGFTEDVPAALSQLDVLVLPSLCGEGLPMVVLEAMAAGLPVVATRVEGTPEAITHGVEGLLAEPGDARSLVHELESLVMGKHDWQTMADAACRRHGASFSDRAMSAKTAEVYRGLLADAS